MLIMAKQYPRSPLYMDQVSTKKLEHLFAYIREHSDCKSSNSILNMLQKGRKSIQKLYFRQLLQEVLGDVQRVQLLADNETG